MSADSSEPGTSAELPETDDAGEQLNAVIEAHEATDWSEVPGVTVAEAAAWTSRLVEARTELEAQR
ncbi:hypothetical protein [Halorubrum tropicale]|uniref:Uncharacterized protein n=1 Tax=Halorubrum tropicale TaxID=1765655 RepID=A0A0N0BPQ2_9EURY|nr:hypothetical protein [Halorubrum tropicale]KOX94236.1 hypothetical protein AMR74_16145 [Halorubrum tropicale]